MADWKRKAAGGGILGDPPSKPAAPVALRIIVSDTTTEALAPILHDNPRGVLLERDEISGWINSFDRYAKTGRGGADAANWLSAHKGGSVTIDRKSGNPPTIHVPSASVCVTGGIQPAILKRAMTQEHHDNGLLARMIFAMPPRLRRRWPEVSVDAATKSAVQNMFDRLLSIEMEAVSDSMDQNGGELRPRYLTLTVNAHKRWRQFFDDHAEEQESLTGDDAAAWSKLEGYAARLALVIHMVRWAANDPLLVDPDQVDDTSIEAGIELVRWFGREARRVYAVLNEGEEDRRDRELVELIQRKGRSVSPRELAQSSRKIRSVADAEALLEGLVRLGLGSWQHPVSRGPGGPASKRFVLNGNVYSIAPGAIENGHSVDVDAGAEPISQASVGDHSETAHPKNKLE